MKHRLEYAEASLDRPSGRLPVCRIEAPKEPFPTPKRPMARRTAFAVSGDGTSTKLRWPEATVPSGAAQLRFVAAVDERVPHRVEILTGETGTSLGVVDVLFACPGQVFGMPLTVDQAQCVLKEGLLLRLAEPTTPLWLVGPGPESPSSLLPQLVFQGRAPAFENFLALFCSPASFQPCDWMGGCVVDGLRDWALAGRDDASATLARYFTVFLDPETGGRENFRSEPCDGVPSGPESTGPFAVLALTQPDHPALALAEKGFAKHYHAATESVGRQVVAETSYNIAYPMMALATGAGRKKWKARALHQLEVNRRFLAGPDDLWLRCNSETGARTFQNWSRGVAWYYLGLIRTLSLLAPHERPESLVTEAARMAQWVARWQTDEGLWPCYLKESGVTPDSSGSAGIGAAVALGVLHGLVERDLLPVAERAFEALTSHYLSPDGWLNGVSQSNKSQTHAMDIQRHPFRVIAPWGMGLYAQLAAGLQKGPGASGPANEDGL